MTGLIIGAVIISFASIMVKLANMPPDVTGFYRLFVGGLGMLLILWRAGNLKGLTLHVWKWALLSASFFTMDLMLWHRSIHLVGPGMATMLTNVQVLLLAAVSVLFLKDKVSRPFLVSIPMALIGLYLMVGVQWAEFAPGYQYGVIFGLLSALAYSCYLLSLKYSLSKVAADPLSMAAAVALISSIFLGALGAAQGNSFVIPDVQSLLALTFLALVCHSIGWFLITRGIQSVKTSHVGLILLLQPTLSYVWDLLFFDKPINPVELTGGSLVLLAIYLGSLEKRIK
jgi:drug/metabolite transporter (DMT)-like permease